MNNEQSYQDLKTENENLKKSIVQLIKRSVQLEDIIYALEKELVKRLNKSTTKNH